MIKNFLITLKPERVFVVLASVFGILYLFLTPPFQSPDENRHFYRAYHISQGSIFATKIDGRVGGYLPKKVKESVKKFSPMQGRVDVITSRSEIMSAVSHKGDETFEFVDFPSMAVYTPVSYIPQAIGIRLARIFSDSTLIALYAGRLMTLIFWMTVLFFAIRITPIFKWLFVALALLPMSVYIHASVSADTITNAIVFLFLATILKQAFSDQKQSRKEFITLVILVFLLASAKFLYSPLVLLFLLIPLKNLASKKQYVLRFFGIGILALLTAACWPQIQGVGYVSYADYNPDYAEKVNLMKCANVQEQTAYIIEHGSFIFKSLGYSLVESYNAYYIGFIGNFGWAEVPLPSFFLIFAYFGLFFLAFSDGNPAHRMSRTQRLTLLTPFILIFALIIISQLLIWTCVGADLVTNLQGRYFIPIAPLLFFAFYRSKNKLQKFLPVGVIVFSSTLLISSAIIIYNRFYIPIEYSVETVKCDHEKGTGLADFGTSNPSIFAGNGFSRSSEKARSGKYSSKLSPEIRYGSLVSFEGCNVGDIFEIEAWRSGPNGVLIVSTEGGVKLYETARNVEESQGDWQKMKLFVRIPPSIENEKVSCYFTYFDDTDSCYFDDMKIKLSRVK